MNSTEQSQGWLTKAGFILLLKGAAMGAADSVPGVSGGTIAFISGIYDELINSIKSLNFRALMILFKQGPKAAWQYINGQFLLTLSLGIIFSAVLLANSVTYLLEYYPRFLMSFFVGLIIASCWFLYTQINHWKFDSVLLVLLGLVFSIVLSLLPESSQQSGLLYLFFCGAIAICAMILPGISGAFILVLLGAYETVLIAVKEHDFLSIGVFMAGCATGLMAFSNVLSFVLTHYRSRTLSLLLGVLIGSLYTIWPGRIETINALVSLSDSLTLFVYIVLATFGFGLVYGLEYFSAKDND